jgi:integrase
MSKSKKKRASPQVSKPYPGFPLCVHPNGSWVKKIKGRLHYFGPVTDPDAALQKYLDQRDDLHAGRIPRAKLEAGPILADAVNAFIHAKKHKLECGDISARSFYDLYAAAERVVKFFRRDRLLTDIRPEDFAAFERTFPKTWGALARGRQIQHTRSIFLYAMTQGLIETVVRFGDFKKPSKSVLRKAKAKARTANGLKMFEADEIRDLLDKAGRQMKAMILLAVNAGLGPTDLASLTFNVIDLDRAILDFPRPKTGIDRRCPLWSETVAALRDAIAHRPTPKDEAHANRVFVTKYGGLWAHCAVEEKREDPAAKPTYRLNFDNAVSKEFNKLTAELKIKRPGRSFYGLRHTTETIGSEARDQKALDILMGHADATMSSEYRERVGDDRLTRVTDHIRSWLFGSKSDSPAILPLTGRAAR